MSDRVSELNARLPSVTASWPVTASSMRSGHLSARSPIAPTHFFISRSLGPELAVRVPVVHDDGGLTVGNGRDHPPVARRAQDVRIEHVDAPRPARMPFAEWSRFQCGVRAQYLFQQAEIGVPENTAT